MENFELRTYKNRSAMKNMIKDCEDKKHKQEIAYSLKPDLITQVCFDCKIIRTNLKTL